MTEPFFTTVVDRPADENRDYIPMARCKGRLLIVRPYKYQAEGFITQHKPEGSDAVFADIAVLDPIPPGENEYGEALKGYPAGFQFRNQVVLQGFLKGTWKRYLGNTLIGTLFFGPKTKGKPPMMWQDLTGDAQCVQRGKAFLVAHPEFLIPVEAAFAETRQEPTGPQPYQQPVAQGHLPDTWQASPQTQNTLEQMRRLALSGQQEAAPF